jgi:hypothetical protein
MAQISKRALEGFNREVKDPKLREWLKIQTEIHALQQQQQRLKIEFDNKQFLNDLGES